MVRNIGDVEIITINPCKSGGKSIHSEKRGEKKLSVDKGRL
jgi:hypothetical protein